MKNFFSDLFYAIKNESGKAKVFYILCFVTLICTLIGFVSGVVAEVVYIVASNFQLLPCILAVVCLALFIGVVCWLNKLRTI